MAEAPLLLLLAISKLLFFETRGDPRTWCQICGKPFHRAIDCWYRNDFVNFASTKPQRNRQALTVQTSDNASSSSSTPMPPTGCTWHDVEQRGRRVNSSVSKRRQILTTPTSNTQSQCLTGNPIDDCWRCDPNWAANRQRLADCAIGFGKAAMGGKGGRFYVVTDSSDHDTVDPTPGTFRHAVIQDEPLWIVFQSNMVIKLKHELIVNSYKTIDGRGANVQITGNGCITLQYVSNVIIHNVHVYNCLPSGNTNIRSSPTHIGYRGKSDGDGISIFARGIYGSIIVHCRIVTIAFNRFGEGLVQRMPRCRRGYIHVVNNDFFQWKSYAIGGSANPTINSEGNRYTAPGDPSAKEVTKREDTNEGEWSDWNWRTNGDIMVNGAFFVPSGEGASSLQYSKASSVEPKSATLIDQLTMNAGVLGGPSPWMWANSPLGPLESQLIASACVLVLLEGTIALACPTVEGPPREQAAMAVVGQVAVVTVTTLE
ncbi:hypothetical protein DH2020_010578 [Rehmannia glutinosa]|uniref:Pectate lyase n=1 Tax=Rehmannia glutinosa TaxID=99300 RepID=A0ABR0XAY8_REHGL